MDIIPLQRIPTEDQYESFMSNYMMHFRMHREQICNSIYCTYNNTVPNSVANPACKDGLFECLQYQLLTRFNDQGSDQKSQKNINNY